MQVDTGGVRDAQRQARTLLPLGYVQSLDVRSHHLGNPERLSARREPLASG